MASLIQGTAELVRALKRIWEQKWSFAGLYLFLIGVSVLVLSLLDLLPSIAPRAAVVVSLPPAATSSPAAALAPSVELPESIEIPAIHLSTMVENPVSTDIPTLDAALLKGAVRYPTSAKLGEVGNVVLFGHSSYLPVVGNKAYKAFNDIQKLKAGDTVIVSSAGTAYTYMVRTVAKESTLDATIPLLVSGRVLTLSTCDSFGAKTDRYVVTADFVDSRPASS